MEEALLKLLLKLEVIGNQHEEAGDTVCRDAMRSAVFRSFLRPEPGYELPDDFGLYDAEANYAVKEAIAEYVSTAMSLAAALGLSSFQQRLAAFQNPSIATRDGTTYDEFFGYQVPRLYDADGKWLGQQ